MKRTRLLLWSALVAAGSFAVPRDAAACGCFAMSSPAAPVVQAGERILFAHENGQVIAYIQIKYQGAADQFAWLVPLPSIPTLEVGTDELFTALDGTTLPQYLLTRVNQTCSGGSTSTTTDESSGGFGCGASDFARAGATDLGIGGISDQGRSAADMGKGGVAVEQASIGPYDFAVLKADDQTALLQWLNDNRYFVPTGTMTAVQPYIHPGGYFLALKLRGGQSTGDIAPIVLHYASDLPMIPITLTSVGAVANMGILVWVLGEARAIPRNYYSVVLDDLPVWFSNFSDYNQQLIAAVREAPGKHGFLTQYAGTSSRVYGRLDYPGRFGDLATLRAQTTASDYLRYLRSSGYTFDGALLSILSRYIPEPPSLVAQGVSPGQFYAQYDFYMHVPYGDDGGVTGFLPGPLTDEITARIVTPAKNADALIRRHPKLTRLYTAMSPIDMTIDPVFSFNADLPDVPLLHSATITRPCSGEPWLRTDEGFETQYISGLPPNPSLPAARRVEKLLDAGPPQTVQDNSDVIKGALGPVSYGSMYAPSSPGGTHSAGGGGGCGCTVGHRRVRTNAAVLFAVAAAALLIRDVRRRRRGNVRA